MVKLFVLDGAERATEIEAEESFDQVWTWLTLPGHFLRVTRADGQQVIVNKTRILWIERGGEEYAGASWQR
ncbi:MAG: hypothetical protein H5T70_10085 [Chloroflexi bacterium]|nr:hypothetical protein [Thermoleophilia bacterium]MBC7316755.1 hypothetical protein [Chloroflexota bacterium]